MSVTGAEALAALGAVGTGSAADRASAVGAAQSTAAAGESSAFAKLLADGIDEVNRDLIHADNTVRSFVLDDTVPVHQVTFALEQARLSLELMMQVRARLVEGYQQIMNMQL